jgi:ribonuclease T1
VTPKALLVAAAIVVVVLLAGWWIDRWATGSAPGSAHGTSAPQAAATPRSGLPTIAASVLPSQARTVLALIDKGGPYPYKQDDTVFSNFEGLLPKRSGGYYHEYTVVTPGSSDRGTRRLIVGHDGDIYYTNDHYDSFRQVIR